MAITALRRISCRRLKNESPGSFARDDQGSAAIELALTAPVFFALMLSIFEFAVMFGTNVLLEAATNQAARALRTGQVFQKELAVRPGQPFATEVEAFEYALCDGLLFIDCEKLSYTVDVFPDFLLANADVTCRTADPDIPGDIDGIVETDFDIGSPAQIVVLTVVYPYKPILPNPLAYSGRSWEEAGGCNGLTLKSVMVFINEPFPQTAPAPPGG